MSGVLEPTGTADDRVIFVDLKTSWIMAGHGHGHQDLSKDAEVSNVPDTLARIFAPRGSLEPAAANA